MKKEIPAYKIEGGQPVAGEIKCLGTKNYASKALVAACLADSPSVLHNMPPIGEIDITINLCRSLGAEVEWIDEKIVRLDPTTICKHKIKMPDSQRNRIPILFIPVLLHHFKKGEVPHLGGDKIGARNVDFHLEAAELFGAEVEIKKTTYSASVKDNLKGTRYHLPYPSVGATETCLMLAVTAEGTSKITNAAIEPEIIELITQLRAMGAVIFLGPNREIRVEGVSKLHGTFVHILGDRIEAGSWASLAAASGGEITVHGIRPNTLANFLSYFRQIGGDYEFLGEESIKFKRGGELRPTMLETDVFPGLSTDLQQPFAVALTQAHGVSVIHETVYENRFGYTKVLNKLGAQIQLTDHCLGGKCRFADGGHKHSALIMGKTPLVAPNEPIEAPDIRAGLAYLIAAAIAKGTTVLTGIHQLERGYGDVPKRVKELNLSVERTIC
jgi:UDP-N-acetylglucosamine 1-carboxyvinyltransferase